MAGTPIVNKRFPTSIKPTFSQLRTLGSPEMLRQVLGGDVGPFRFLNSDLNSASRSSAEQISQTLGGDPSPLVTDEQREMLRQFFSPTLGGTQAAQVQNVKSTAFGRGLFGGAVETRLDDMTNRFLAQNRAEGFNATNEVAHMALSKVVSGVLPFFQTVGALNNRLQQVAVGSEDKVDPRFDVYRRFVGTGLRALQSFGQGAAGVAGLAGSVGMDVQSQQGAGEVGRLFAEFINPGTMSMPRTGKRTLNIPKRLQAGTELMQKYLQPQAQAAQSAAAQFSALGSAALAYRTTGGREGTKQLAQMDMSRFKPMLSLLGI